MNTTDPPFNDDLFDDDYFDDEDDDEFDFDEEMDDDKWNRIDEELAGNGRYYDDDGNRVFPELLIRPKKCLGCTFNKAKGMELVLCNLNRLSFVNDESFDCAKFEAETDQSVVAKNSIPLN